jgi:class 3 adenylate cyclase
MTVTDGRVLPEDGDLVIGVGRRIQAAVLFLDICGFSERRSESKMEQESLLRVLAFFFSEIVKIIEDYGGQVEKNTGDGLMAYFPADASEKSHESQRAVAAAMTIFYSADFLLNPVISATLIPKVDFRICIDHGSITIADVGAARRFHGFVAIGATANIACKMLNVADHNQIVIGESVHNTIPLAWQLNHSIRRQEPTGFHYTLDGREYPCYTFDGRWTEPKP